eukprot:CAMPEP_0117578340 /NCGR_PEP_ID=MMETSP0784-20121206/63947_1 /TAXON_ID=39447 /ORGANISM="" /LENGTH=155 /DNA_ID=CAMNT_0005377989 /DNA_START=1 /DNA_END=468 /DNA_ORIENTATION=+
MESIGPGVVPDYDFLRLSVVRHFETDLLFVAGEAVLLRNAAPEDCKHFTTRVLVHAAKHPTSISLTTDFDEASPGHVAGIKIGVCVLWFWCLGPAHPPDVLNGSCSAAFVVFFFLFPELSPLLCREPGLLRGLLPLAIVKRRLLQVLGSVIMTFS